MEAQLWPVFRLVLLRIALERTAPAAPPSARQGRPAAARVHLGHQQAEGISRRADQLPTSEAAEDKGVSGARAQI